MKPRRILVVHYQPHSVLGQMRRLLKSHGLSARYVARDSLTEKDTRGCDLVISIGGDGTFLSTARRVHDALMLGVNPAPEKKEGFLSRATPETLGERLEQLIEDRFAALSLTRLAPMLDGKALPLALNEVFVADKNPHKMSHYRLKVEDRDEFQKSSGVLVSTATGSHGWLRSAGGIPMPMTSRGFQWHVRDPFSGRLLKPLLTTGTLDEGETLSVKSVMDSGIVVVDSIKVSPFRKGSVLTITTSERRLRFADFPE